MAHAHVVMRRYLASVMVRYVFLAEHLTISVALLLVAAAARRSECHLARSTSRTAHNDLPFAVPMESCRREDRL